MAQVLIRDIEPDIVTKLKTRAQQNKRSLEAELRLILWQAAHEEKTSITQEVERVQALFAGRAFSDSVELLREDRER
jgi:plasmid stability protein